MKLSGTNSVNPPVRSCSSRTTRMCSASSQGSSMWPNITVTVERRPARCEASMISTQRPTGSLFGRDPLAHAVVEHLGGGARRRAEPALDAGTRTRPRGALARALAHVVHLHRRVRVQVHVRAPSPSRAAASARSPRACSPGWMPPCMQISVTPKSTASRTFAAKSSSVDVVGVRRALALAEPAERAADLADVREVDVAVDDERGGVAGEPRAQLVGRQPHVLDHLGPALGEQRRQLCAA